ncbi:MAG: hypothetical protein IKU41_01210 [Clostridia bacterium]|nr:hypothetical protein [Clostridia bacterium]
MGWLFWGVLAVGIVVTGVFLYLRVKEERVKAVFTKAAASLCFIGTGLVAFSLNRDNFEYAILMIFGLVFSMLGDIWLDLKYIYKEHSDTYSFAGFGSFMVAHTFFVPAVIMGYDEYIWWHFVVDAVMCLILIINTITMEKRDNLHYGKFKNITILYTVFVMGTMLLSINGFVVSGFKSIKYLVLVIASISFALSDLVLAKIYFGDKNNGTYVAVNHILYYVAQFLFASSILL